MGAEDFVKLSVNYLADFRLHSVSSSAELLFLRGLAECGLRASGGILTPADVAGLAHDLRKPPSLIAELIRAGYWQKLPTGYRYCQWDKWQGDFDLMTEKRKRDAQRKREKRRADREVQYSEEAS